MFSAPHLSLAVLLLILAPVIGKLVQWIVNGLKVINAFANSSAWVKQITGFIVAAVLGFIGTHLGLTLTGNSLDTITGSDISSVITALLALVLPYLNSALAWLFAMVFHNSTKSST